MYAMCRNDIVIFHTHSYSVYNMLDLRMPMWVYFVCVCCVYVSEGGLWDPLSVFFSTVY